MKTYRYLYGTDLAGAYEEIYRSPGLMNYLRDRKQILGVDHELDMVRGLYAFDKLNGYGQHSKKNIPVVVQYMPMLKHKLGVWGVGGAANAGNEGVWADLANNTGRSTTYTQLELFDLDDVAGTRFYNHLDILFGMEQFRDQDVVDARNKRRDMGGSIRIEQVAPVMQQMDKEHILAAAEALFSGKSVIFHLERGVFFPHRSRELLLQLYSMLPPLFAKEMGYSCYCRAETVKDLTKHQFRVFVIPGEEPLDPGNYPERQYLILEMSSRRNAGSSQMWDVLDQWWDMPWAERVEVLQRQFRDSEQLGQSRDSAKFISVSREYFEMLKCYHDWKAQKTSIPSGGVTIEKLVEEYGSYSFWDAVPGAREHFALWSMAALGGREALQNLTEKSFAEWAMGTDQITQNSARRNYNLGSQLCNPRGSGMQRNIQDKIDAKVQSECALAMAAKNEQIEGLNAKIDEKVTEINSLQGTIGINAAEIKKLNATIGEKDTEIKKLNATIGEKDTEIKKLNATIGEKDTEINSLQETIGEKDTEIKKLNATIGTNATMIEGLKKTIGEKDEEISRVRAECGKLNILLQNDNAGKRLRWLMGIPLLGKGTQFLLDRRFDREDKEDDVDPVAIEPEGESAPDVDKESVDNNAAPVQSGQNDDAAAVNGEEAPMHDGVPEDGGSDSDMSNTTENSSKEKNEENDEGGNSGKGGEDGTAEGPKWDWRRLAIPAAFALFAVVIGAIMIMAPGKNEVDPVPTDPIVTTTAASYDISCVVRGEGTLIPDCRSAKAGETVTVTVTPKKDWQINKVCDGEGKALQKEQDNKYTLVMPEHSVTIEAEFTVIETKPIEHTAPKFELTQELMDEICEDFQVSVRMEFGEDFEEESGLLPAVLITEQQAANGALPKNYVLVLKEAPKKLDSLYAYIGYGDLHVAVNYAAEGGNDAATELAFKIFSKLVATTKYPEGIRFCARLDSKKSPVDLAFTCNKIGADWYLHLKSWKSGRSTETYQKDHSLEERPYVVVEGEGWTIAYVPSSNFNTPESQEKLKNDYDMSQSMEATWALYLIDDAS